MQLLERIWTDIKRGENIDLYATVLVAFGLVLFNIFSNAAAAWIAPLTLAVLGLLAVSSLGNRYRLEELLLKVDHSRKEFFLDDYPVEIKQNIEMARELWMVGVTLNRTVREGFASYTVLEQKLRKGHTIRVLLVHPEGTAVEIVSERYIIPARRDLARTCANIHETLDILTALRNIGPGKLEVRTIQTALTYGAFAVNPESRHGILYMEHYPFRTVSNSQPKVILHFEDGEWYEMFRKELRTLWEAGVPWEARK